MFTYLLFSVVALVFSCMSISVYLPEKCSQKVALKVLLCVQILILIVIHLFWKKTA